MSYHTMKTIWLRVCHTGNASWFTRIRFLLIFSLVYDPPDNIDRLVDLYNSTLMNLVDEHGPLIYGQQIDT